MRLTRQYVVAVALASLLLGGSSLSAAQEVRESPFGETVEVRLVNVEVWVTDGKGNRISGLAADDFRVFEDGEPVQITHFAEVQGSQPVAAPRQIALQEEALDSPPPQAPLIEPSHLVLYFDHLHLSPLNRPRILKDVRRFLEKEQISAERVLILSQTRDLITEVPFGSSSEEIDLALTRIAKSGVGGAPLVAQQRLAVDELQRTWELAQTTGGSSGGGGGSTVGGVDATCEAFVGKAVPQILAMERVSREHIRATLNHLAAVTGFLNGLPGVKTLVYVSDSLERQPGESLKRFVTNLCPTTPTPRLSGLGQELTVDFSRLTRHANANRVTIYALQTTGLQASFTGGAEQRGLESYAVGGVDYAFRETERAGMTLLADQTGGRAIFNRNRFGGAFGEIVDEMANYYSLAYVPDHQGDLAEHQIRVEIDAPGRKTSVRYRRSYQDKSPDTKMAERLDGAIFLGLLDNPLDVRLGAGVTEIEDEQHVTLPLHVMIPIEKLAFLPEEAGEIANLSLQIKTQDTRTQKSTFEQKSLRVERPPADQELLSVSIELRLPRGVHLIAAAVRDDATQQSSYVSTTVELVASTEGDQAERLTPAGNVGTP